MIPMIRFIITIVILIAVLSLFGVSIEDLFTSSTNQANLEYVWQLAKDGFNFTVNLIVALIS